MPFLSDRVNSKFDKKGIPVGIYLATTWEETVTPQDMSHLKSMSNWFHGTRGKTAVHCYIADNVEENKGDVKNHFRISKGRTKKVIFGEIRLFISPKSPSPPPMDPSSLLLNPIRVHRNHN